MSIKILPLELLTKIFKCVDNDTLYHCIRVNKLWHTFNIPILWKALFYFTGSIKILINCLLVEDKDFLTRNNITLNFKLLKKPPLYNYVKFATELNFQLFIGELKELVDNDRSDEFNCFKKRLLDFILDHSTLRILKNIGPTINLIVYDFRFEACFRNLYRLDCNCTFASSEFFDKITKCCKNIQILKINYGSVKTYYDLTQLIKAQNKITELGINSLGNLFFSDDFREAISSHSKSIISYEGFGENNLEPTLMPMFQNLKNLSLYKIDSNMNYLKSILFPYIQELHLEFYYQSFLLDLSVFIKANGKTLKKLSTKGSPVDREHLGTVIQLIGRHCKDLEILTILYANDLDAQLIELFNNCIKLKKITFMQTRWGYKFNVDKILSAIDQTSPKNLNTLHFIDDVDISVNSLETFMNNWKGPRPFTFRFYGPYDKFLGRNEVGNLLREYQKLGFLSY